jgi:hypothetical protein
MSKRKKNILLTFAGLLTALVVYVIVMLVTSDAALSIVPGWHTTIEYSEFLWAALVLAISLLVYLVFRGAFKLLSSVWTKFNHKRN